MQQISIYDMLKQIKNRMQPTDVAQGSGPPLPMSLPGVYERDTQGAEVRDTEARTFIPYRTLPPQTDYVYGADKQPYDIADNDTLQSPPIGPAPNELPIWRGWRPNRPVISYKELGMQIIQDQQGPGIESAIPQEREMVNMADERATAPFPTLPESMQITPEMQNDKGIYLETPSSVHEETNMKGMGDDVTDAIGTVAKDVVSSIQAKYGTNPAQIKAAAQAQSTIPWGTLALVGVVGAAAIFLLPKLTK